MNSNIVFTYFLQKNIRNVYFHKKVQGTKNEDVFVDFVVDIVNLLFLKEYHMEKMSFS